MTRFTNILDHHSDAINPVIEVFKTNVSSERMTDRVLGQLSAIWPDFKINFDLDDCDNILRVESSQGRIEAASIIKVVESLGYTIETLV